MSPEIRPLDRIDRALLAVLQEDARISNKELAARVGLAPSSCHARVQRLVAEGVLLGFHARVRPEALGIGLRALVTVRLTGHAWPTSGRLVEDLENLPWVTDVYHVAGADDLILAVATRDVDHLRRVLLEDLSSRPEVDRIHTTLVFEHRRAAALPDLLG